jgi:O-antigen/teichoic acid export membrane protein
VSRAYEAGAKVLALTLFPLGVGAALFAEPLIRIVYGRPFLAATTSLRLLAATIALYGFSYLSNLLLVSQDRQRIIPWVTGAVAVENIVLNVLLIPHYSLNGAAFATSVTELTRATVLMGFAASVMGSFSLPRILAGPLIGCAAIGLVAWILGPSLLAMAVAAIAYPAVLLAVEQRLYPGDVRTMFSLTLGRRRDLPGAGGPSM